MLSHNDPNSDDSNQHGPDGHGPDHRASGRRGPVASCPGLPQGLPPRCALVTRASAVVALVAASLALYLAFGGAFAPLVAVGTSPFALLAFAAVGMIAFANIRHMLRIRAARTAADAAARAEIERLALVARRTTNAVIITDVDRRIVWVNEGFTRITGYTLDEVRGRAPGSMLQGPNTDPETIARMREALHRHEGCRVEIANYSKDGREYILDIEIQPLRDAAGSVTGFMAIESDITESVRAREEIASAVRRMNLVVAGADLGTWEWNLESGEVLFNDRWSTMLGYSPIEIARHVHAWHALIHADDRPRVERALREHLEGRSDFLRVEHRMLRKDGSLAWMHSAGKVSERDASGRPLRMSGIHLDVTDRQERRELERLNALLGEQNRRLEEMSERAHRFVDDVSHEFRTPLTVIREFNAIIAEGLGGPVTDQQSDWLRMVDVAAADLNQLVEDFLDSSKLRAGRLRVDRRACGVQAVLDGLLRRISRKAASRGISILTEIEPGTPEFFGDEEKVRRIVMNLLTNAVKFSPDGGDVVVSVCGTASGDVEFAVEDHGPGLMPGDRARLFERFRQLPNALAPSVKGFGLGLNIAHQLVWLNLGAISVESEYGKGARFTFTVPTADPAIIVERFFERLGEREEKPGRVAMLRIHAVRAGSSMEALRGLVVASTRAEDIVLPSADGRSLVAFGPCLEPSIWRAQLLDRLDRLGARDAAVAIDVAGAWTYPREEAAARAHLVGELAGTSPAEAVHAA
jgi:PAS domain S-box-containing protein